MFYCRALGFEMTEEVMSISLSMTLWKSKINACVGICGLVCWHDASNLNPLFWCVIDVVSSCGGISSNMLQSPKCFFLNQEYWIRTSLTLSNKTIDEFVWSFKFIGRTKCLIIFLLNLFHLNRFDLNFHSHYLKL